MWLLKAPASSRLVARWFVHLCGTDPAKRSYLSDVMFMLFEFRNVTLTSWQKAVWSLLYSVPLVPKKLLFFSAATTATTTVSKRRAAVFWTICKRCRKDWSAYYSLLQWSSGDRSINNFSQVFKREVRLHLGNHVKLKKAGSKALTCLSNLKELSKITPRFLTAEKLHGVKRPRVSTEMSCGFDYSNPNDFSFIFIKTTKVQLHPAYKVT